MATETPPTTFEFFSSDPQPVATYIVLGSPRGGTSMVSGLLRLLGINMGDEINEANNEDTGFTRHKGNRRLFTVDGFQAERGEFIQALRRLISERNDMRPVWGWKDPISTYYLPEVLDVVRNPRLIVVTRDPAAVAGRQAVSRSDDHGRGFEIFKSDIHNALMQYGDAVNAVEHFKIPTLFISYERAVAYPSNVIESLLAFTGCSLPSDSLTADRLNAYIQPERNTGSITSDVKRALPRQGGMASDIESRYEASRIALNGTPAGDAIKNEATIPGLLAAMASGLQTKDFDAVIFAAEIALKLGRKEVSGIKRDPRLYFDESQSGFRGSPLPNWSCRLYFQLGMALIQVQAHYSAYWCFRTCVGLAERLGDKYEARRLGVPFWATLFHLGLAAKHLGWMTEYKLICLRIREAEHLGLQPDSIAVRDEAAEYAKYSSRIGSHGPVVG